MKEIRVPFSTIRMGTKICDTVHGMDWWLHDTRVYRVRVSSLIATQHWVTLVGLNERMRVKPREALRVVKLGRKLYIRDGHHRATLAKWQGKKTVVAEVADLTGAV